jgi:peptidyl-prolyl cis-trans isomerase SurA
MKILHKFPDRFSAVLYLLVANLLFASPSVAMVYDRVIAKVNSEIVTLSAVYEREHPFRQMMSSTGEKIPPREELLKQILDIIIEEKLQIQHGKKLGIQVDEDRVEAALNDVKEDNGINDEQMKMMLEKEGRTIEQYKEQIRNQLIMGQVARYQFGRNLVVKDSLIEKYYERTKKDYWVPGKISVRHILFILEDGLTDQEIEVKRKRAEMVLAEIRSGKSFEDMARLYSEDVSASSGGEIGTLQKGRMVQEFDEAAFALKEGGVSEIVKTQFGFHIIKVDKLFAGHTKPLDDKLREKLKNLILKKATEEKYNEWVKKLKKDAFIEITWNEDKKDKGKSPVAKEKTENNSVNKVASSSKSLKKGKPSEWKADSIETSQSASSKSAVREGGLGTLERKLRYYKKLRDGKKISESTYQKKKQELLNQL